MTDIKQQAAEYLALADAATPGPWYHVQAFQRVADVRTIHGLVKGQRVDFVDCKPLPVHGPTIIPMEGRECHVQSNDMAFIAASHQAADIIRALLALVGEWEQKAANWFASPEAAQQLDGYRELSMRAFEAEAERDRLQAEIERLQEDCAEAYQVVGALAGDRFGDPDVTKALDNLSAAANGEPRPHDDLLPFAPQSDSELPGMWERADLVGGETDQPSLSDLQSELDLSDAAREKMADLLTRTANALRGDPEPLSAHSWHDLPERAAAAVAAIDVMQRAAAVQAAVPVEIHRCANFIYPGDYIDGWNACRSTMLAAAPKPDAERAIGGGA